MPKTKIISQIGILLLCLFVLLCFAFGFNAKTSQQKVMAQGPTSLIDLNDDYYLIDQAMLAGGAFSTIDGGPYDYNTNPYEIASALDLIKLAFLVDYMKDASYASASYVLTNHINLSAYNWRPIGSFGAGNLPFSGAFNGNGYSIYGLTINLFFEYDVNDNVITTTEQTENSVLIDYTTAGLFGAVQNTGEQVTIKLLGLSNTKINTNAYYTGSVVGKILGDPTDTNITMTNTTVSDAVASAVIQECYNTGFVSGGAYVGGIAGYVADGAVVFNCSNGEMLSEEYKQLTYGEENLQAKIAVYSQFSEANVGGIVGGIEETTNKGVVISCLNTASVAKYGNGDNVGGILGYFPSGSKGRYASNIFLNSVVYTSNTTNVAGTAQTFVNLPKSSTYSNKFSIRHVGSGQYLPYTRGNTPDAIWHRGDSINNGVPYLTRVSPLAKVEILVQEKDGVTPATANFVGYDTNGNKVSAMTWHNPVVVSGSVFYIEQGRSVPLNTEILSQYQDHFEFVEWEMSPCVSNITNSEISSVPMTANILFIASDGVYTAVYDYVYYDVNIVPENALYGSVAYKNPISNNSAQVDWDNVELQADNVIHARKDDVVRVVCSPSAGYAFDSIVSANNALTITTISENVYEFVVTGDDVLSFKFIKKTYNIDVVVPTNSNNVDLCSISFSVDGGAYQISTTTASFNSVVNIQTNNIMQSYFLDHYQISATGLTAYDLAQDVSSFVIQDYQDYIITPVFRKQTYLVTLNQNSNNFELAFTNPDASGVQQPVNFDSTFEVRVQNIAPGYHFVEWVVQYSGDSNEVWDTTNTTLQKTGLSGNVTLSAVVQIDMLTVSLSVVGSGTITNSGSNSVAYGTTINSVATPTNGNKFVGWFNSSNALITKRANLSQSITGDFEAYAKFEVCTYNVVFSVVADDGTVFGTGVVQQTNVSGNYSYGDVVEFSVACPAGYVFQNFALQSSLNDGTYTLNDDGTGVISSITKDVFILVNLKLIQYDVTFSINDIRFGDFNFNFDGWTKLSSNLMSHVYNYAYKSQLQATVLKQSEAPYSDVAKNYAFSHWIVNQVPYDVGSTLTISVTENLNIQAIYRPLNYRFTLTKTYEEGANISGLSSDFFEFGSKVVLNANVNSGFEFNGWFSYDIVTRESTLLSKDNQIEITVDSPKNIVCSLSKLAAVVANPNDPLAGSVGGAGNYKIGAKVTLVAQPSENYVFECWKKDNKIVGTDVSLTVDVDEGTQYFEAVFGPAFKVDIMPNNKKLGSVSINNAANNTIELVAVANNNCSFVGWAYNNEIISTDSVFNLNLNGDVELEAVFKRDFNWNILIIIAGCVLFAIVLLIIAVQYVRSKEAEPIKTNYILKTVDDTEVVTKKHQTKNIESIPVRKVNPGEIEPVPVRKTYTKTTGYVRKNLPKQKKDKKE